MSEQITLEYLVANHPAYALNAVLFKLAKAMGHDPDENGGIAVNTDDLLDDVAYAIDRFHSYDGNWPDAHDELDE